MLNVLPLSKIFLSLVPKETLNGVSLCTENSVDLHVLHHDSVMLGFLDPHICCHNIMMQGLQDLCHHNNVTHALPEKCCHVMATPWVQVEHGYVWHWFFLFVTVYKHLWGFYVQLFHSPSFLSLTFHLHCLLLKYPSNALFLILCNTQVAEPRWVGSIVDQNDESQGSVFLSPSKWMILQYFCCSTTLKYIDFKCFVTICWTMFVMYICILNIIFLSRWTYKTLPLLLSPYVPYLGGWLDSIPPWDRIFTVGDKSGRWMEDQLHQ